MELWRLGKKTPFFEEVKYVKFNSNTYIHTYIHIGTYLQTVLLFCSQVRWDDLFLSLTFASQHSISLVSAFPLCHGAVRSLHINSFSSIIDAPIYGTYILDSFSSLRPSLLYNRCNNLLHEKALMYLLKWKAPVECTYIYIRIEIETLALLYLFRLYAGSALLGHADRMGSARPVVVKG